MSDYERGKKMAEEMDLEVFLRAYALATGEVFVGAAASETPDFIGEDVEGNLVGIELTQLKFDPDHMFWRRTFDREEWVDHNDAHWRIIELIAKKSATLSRGGWPRCARRILVIQLIDSPPDELLPNLVTDRPNGTDFDEIWLADYTQLHVFGGVDLFPILHATLEGLFPVASEDRKPYG
jgi:hypothetical protein